MFSFSGKGGRISSGSSLSRYVVKNIALQKVDDSNPREAILKFAQVSCQGNFVSRGELLGNSVSRCELSGYSVSRGELSGYSVSRGELSGNSVSRGELSEYSVSHLVDEMLEWWAGTEA